MVLFRAGDADCFGVRVLLTLSTHPVPRDAGVGLAVVQVVHRPEHSTTTP
ncbi:hypothetical protein [Nocardiopsis ansamitocini]|uniref:Uncharacterized protein n=1 Tax=Nocardiopsis ansamitocini TaxID=1670832 RepID=A0A9W6PB34_9ACTN|nr:hypothetical protein [Nocardiopsis ansamitocini]GLU50273.1 hypothetical protein Nans01_46240 [Nocardiopsis ansamitocini]